MESTPSYRKIIQLNDQFAKTSLRRRFSNEVYISKTKVIETSYLSPYSIKYVHEGSDHYKIGGQSRKLTQQSVLVTNAGTDIELIGDSKKSKVNFNLGMSIFVDEHVVSEVSSTLTLSSRDIVEHAESMIRPTFYDNVVHHDQQFTRFVSSLYDYFSQYPDTYLSDNWYYLIAEQLLFFHDRSLRQLASLSQKKLTTKNEILKRTYFADEYLRDLGADTFSLNEVARVAGLSKYFLIRSFREIFKVTPHQRYLQYKTRLASHLLRKHCPTEVALLLHYPSVQSFSRQYRQITGITPSKANLKK
ncbi:MAG TPA: helix-turn-helix domain-containing protein [Chryseosolibacter sp.]|nr:helix-turn-helix domain-containing protein [Chryseosolibacter sp.]